MHASDRQLPDFRREGEELPAYNCCSVSSTEAHMRGEMGECDVLTNLKINFLFLSL